MDNVKFCKTHKWLKKDANVIDIGITHYAAEELGDIVFIELPQVGDKITKGQSFGVVESVKAVSDLVSPITGNVIAINTTLGENPELVNKDPNKEWFIKVENENEQDFNNLINENEYNTFLQKEKISTEKN